MSTSLTNYEFLDCGNGRRLERVDGVTLEREAPQAHNSPGSPELWKQERISFRKEVSWQGLNDEEPGLPNFHWGPLDMELRCSENGQIGIYPEQGENWNWLYERLSGLERPVRILSGFAYTGASSLICAAALRDREGAEVCHLDSSRSAVNWARCNRDRSGLPEDAVRFIVEDINRFLEREIKRGRRYDGLILDPPAFGRARGKTWVLKRDLPRLMELCRQVLSPEPLFFLLSCHDPALSRDDLARQVAACTSARAEVVETLDLVLPSEKGRSLPNGIAARWFRPQ